MYGFPEKLKRNIHFQFRKNETQIHELLYLFWECTQRCNINCIHCGSDCSKDASMKDMPAEHFFAVLDDINQHLQPNKDIIVVITGGEPLMRKDLEFCGLEIRKRNFRWGIVTNGLLYTEERHASLLNAGIGSATLSFDGLRDAHNWIRGTSKSFDKALSAMEIMASSKRLNFDVVTCVNQKNIHELDEIKSILIANQVKAWRLFTIAPIGRAKNNEELFLNKEQFTTLMEFIKKERASSQIDIKFSCEGYVGPYEKQVRDDYFFCRAGINIGSVLIDGSISACPNVDRSLAQGNIYSDSFSEIWNSEFQAMRDRIWTKTGRCNKCKEYKYCNGNGLHLWDYQNKKLMVCHSQPFIEK